MECDDVIKVPQDFLPDLKTSDVGKPRNKPFASIRNLSDDDGARMLGRKMYFQHKRIFFQLWKP